MRDAVLLVTGALLLSACAPDPHDSTGFVLPRGDKARGQATFQDIGCTQCHTVSGVSLRAHDGPMRFNIRLGGEVLKVRSYGELLNAIVNPDHELADAYRDSMAAANKTATRSPMPNFNHIVTIAQLIDIVEFLHGQYTLTVPEYQGILYGP